MVSIEKSNNQFNNSIRLTSPLDSNIQNIAQDKDKSKGQIKSNINSLDTKKQSNDTVDINGRRLTRKQLAILLELKKRDQQVRQHEMAHLIAGGQYVRGGPNYVYEVGPDGRRYAVGGDVSIDTSPEKDPHATLRKMLTVERAALAPSNPSAQDRAVAAKAAQEASKAQMEIIEMQQQSHQNRLSYVSGIKGNKDNQNSGQNNLSSSRYLLTSSVNNTIGNFLNIFI